MYNLNYNLEHIFSLGAQLQKPEVIGPVPEGIRINFYCLSGEVTGPKLQGRCKAGGGDFLTIRTDGVAILNVHIILESHDGAQIAVAYSGVSDAGENGHQDFLAGKTPATLPIVITPRCQTAHPAYTWLNRVQCLGIGKIDFTTLIVTYDIYAVR